jgi:hypothetical protein
VTKIGRDAFLGCPSRPDKSLLRWLKRISLRFKHP